MPTPDKPVLDYSYTAFQEGQGDNSFPGTQLDNDLANLKLSIDETIDFASLVIRDDGKLNNGVVTKSSLAADVLTGVGAPTVWATATDYVVDETVTTNNGLYLCLDDHTSGVFATDLAAGKWTVLAVWSPLTEVADNSISTPKLVDAAVTGPKVAENTLPGSKMADGSIPRSKMAANFGLMPVGATLDWDGPLAPAGWVFKFGQELSRSTYSALLGALTAVASGNLTSSSQSVTGVDVDLRNLGLEGAAVEGTGIPPGTTINSVTATTVTLSQNASVTLTGVQLRIFPHGSGNGSTTFNVPDDCGRVSAGRDNMGGSATSRLTIAGTGASNVNGARLGATGGVDRHTLTQAQLPAYSSSTIETAGNHEHGYDRYGGLTTIQQGTGVSVANVWFGVADAFTDQAGARSLSIPLGGSGNAHPIVQPTRVTNKIIFTGVI